MLTNLLISALLPILAQRESGGDWNAVGKKGERGLYQFMRATWNDCSKARFHEGLPWCGFDNAIIPSWSDDYAAYWLQLLNARISKAQKRSATRGQVLAAWNAGFDRMRRVRFDVSKAPRSTRRFVADVERELKR